jgi:antitoxin (DNA-binding transcriptional repressor) of toxin-antitoxin stability system
MSAIAATQTAAVLRSVAAGSTTTTTTTTKAVTMVPPQPRRGSSIARHASLRGANGAEVNGANSLTSDDVSSWTEIETQVANMCAAFAGDSSVNGRIMVGFTR